MATYAIGDIQGCYDDLMHLLDHLGFDASEDTLWFVGDLVNRGPRSLDVLRFVRDLGDRAVTVLGNHDLHLLAVAAHVEKQRRKDTLDEILAAPDRDELLDWLRHRPLLHHAADTGFTLVHAGLPPQWDLRTAANAAREVEEILRTDDMHDFFEHMYGNEPDQWSEGLTGWDRLRFITNAFTRLRYCDVAGCMAMKEKGTPGSQPKGYMPWFQVPGRASAGLNIVFGHWSTLGTVSEKGIHALDTGCVWGGPLTALRLSDTPKRYQVACPGWRRPGKD